MFLLMIHQVTPYLSFGLASALFLFWLAKRLNPLAFDRPNGRRLTRLLVMAAFIGFQLISWRYGYFFRDPERAIPQGSTIVSPADGFVVYVRSVKRNEVPLAVKDGAPIRLEEILKMDSPLSEGILIGIFMTPMSVHVNRAPMDGVIERRVYFNGTPMRSMMPMALRTMFARRPFERGSQHLLQNERETLLIRGKQFPVVLTRIADPYVDKIVLWKKEGETVLRGERIGLIKMGSQADLMMPPRVNGRPVHVQVKEGQYVYAGSTVLATFE